jgi:hypothetical protein
MNHRTRAKRFLLKATTLSVGAVMAGCSSSPANPPCVGVCGSLGGPIDAGDASADEAAASGGTGALDSSTIITGVVASPLDGGDA